MTAPSPAETSSPTRPKGLPTGLPLPTRFTTPELFVVGPRVWGLRDVFVNLYFVRADDQSLAWVLVDAGLPGSADKVREAARQLFGPDVPPAAIVLTHAHFDHVGALDAWPDVPVYAHTLELPYLTGRSAYPPPDPTVGGGAMAWLSFMYPRAPRDLGARVRPLNDDHTVPDLPGWRYVFTPGHAPGHVSLFREADRLLIAGDAVTTVRGESAYRTFTQTPELNGPPAYFTPDWDAARESVGRLASLEPETVASGHGVPLSGAALRRHLDELARDFDRVTRPAHGRYVHEPARFDETGVRYVPPPVGPPHAWIAGAAAILAAVGVLAWRRGRRPTNAEKTPGDQGKTAAGRRPAPARETDRGYGGMAVGNGVRYGKGGDARSAKGGARHGKGGGAPNHGHFSGSAPADPPGGH